MIFERYELGCLSLYSYLVGDESTGRAVVVDPQRDVSQYLEDARRHGLSVERVIETHFHADFLSGHLELAATTGATISYGEGAEPAFEVEHLADARRISLGEVTLEILATPGHTPESICIVIRDHPDAEPFGVLTGDTLFVGDVGRPDLLAAAGQSPEDLGRQLFRSLRDKLLTLPDDTRVFPAHGAGSACGKHMSSAPSSTIGEQRRTNYALAIDDEDAFLAAVVGGQSVVPPYFGFAAAANKSGHLLLDEGEPPRSLTLEEVVALQAGGAVVVDGRSPEVFAAGHVAGAVNIPLEGRFAEYAGDVLSPDDDVVIAAERGRTAEARVRLARIGFDRVVGALPDPASVLAAHPEVGEQASRLAAADLATWWSGDGAHELLDVRNPPEHAEGHVVGSRLVPLPELVARLAELDEDRLTVVYCQSGRRSSVAASLLRARGFGRVADVPGGFPALERAGFPVEP